MRRTLGLALLPLTLAFSAPAQQAAPERPLGTLREQAEIQQQWLAQRLETVLPRLMREQGVDLWIVTMREYHEDPVFHALVSPTTFFARRRTIYVFFDRGPQRGVERLALGGASQGGLYQAIRETERAPDGRQRELWGKAQWDLLARVVRERNPQRIALNISQTHAFSDGLTFSTTVISPTFPVFTCQRVGDRHRRRQRSTWQPQRMTTNNSQPLVERRASEGDLGCGFSLPSVCIGQAGRSSYRLVQVH